jgi:ribosomal protein L24E
LVKGKYRCVVCGRVFPEGQGIILRVDDDVIPLHSSKCATKFLRSVVERLEPSIVRGVIKDVKKEFHELLEKRLKESSKKI